jgi:prepilin-type processing-associated H-X9-DG protein
MWSQDHDETLPPAKGWAKELEPYLRNLELFRCPGARNLTCGYAFNLDVAGKRLADIERPSETVLFYESTLGSLDAADKGESQPQPGRHNGGNNLAYVDGHVRWQPGAAEKGAAGP